MTTVGLALFLLRRSAVLVLLLIAISFAVFSLLYISPGDVVDILLGQEPRTPETVQALRLKYRLDDPFLAQYWNWVTEAAQFRFGDSIYASLPVADMLKARLPTSLALGAYSFLLTLLLGVGLGLVAALRRGRALDRAIVAVSVIGLSTPAFVSGVLLLYVFAILLNWLPAFGRGDGFVDGVRHLTLPAVSLALASSAYLLKHTRAAALAVLDQDYVVFAKARGLSPLRILFSYVLRNALIPVVTISGLLLAFLITGAVLVESVFSLPGIGRLLAQSATVKDLPVVQGVTMVVAVVIMLANMLADLLYVIIDPRIRFGRRAA